MPESNNSERIEIGRGTTYLRISGRDIIIIALLAAALGYILWITQQGHRELHEGQQRILTTIDAACEPRYSR